MNEFWYRNSVIYELNIRAFMDSDGNGRGDFRGLIARLEYLESLGIDCIWLLPMYPSPGRDDGYDVADYYNINPEYGTLEDFREFIDKAHARGIRVIGELVMNHTSDMHPWFQEAKKGPESPFHDWYVWSDTPERYRDARIIFVDTEKSNWAWCESCGKYYWHRFFSHQPDLNFDNPAVREEMKNIVRFWLDLGLDGFRVDAVPYLFEREGTSCENLEETHAFVRELRAFIDTGYQGRILLAEANQWPEDLVPYFSNGDEFHMAYNFPVMPRMFMAIKQEHHGPIVDIMQRLPQIPEGCQWATFLRNHDELTLEMCTDAERDYMYATYARDPQMKCNIGIRRRLAPLVENDRRKIELLHAMLFALPGTPVLYYGDEIGMGDNIWLGDRNGVRTPMQWDDGRNAGFSRCAPSRLYAPVIMDPIYSYSAVNVEVQDSDPSSLLNFMRRLIRVRKEYPAFGSGSLRFFFAENKRIMALMREYEGERLLCVFNLANSCQYAMLEIQELAGCVPHELIDGAVFPPIGELPYLLTFGPHGFYLFKLE